MLLQIVMGTTILLIKWEYLDYQKDPEERETGLGLYPEIIYQTQLTLLYGSDTGQNVLKLWFTLIYSDLRKSLIRLFYSTVLDPEWYRPELQPNKKVPKLSQMLGTFYLMKWVYFYNKLVLMTLKVCAEISGRDF